MGGDFYVYELADPRDDSVFYVGKGKGSRLNQHAKDANRGVEGEKCDRIRAIIADGHSPTARVVQEFDDEQDAFDAEARLIDSYGLENLTNIVPGGGAPRAPTPPDPVRSAKEINRKCHKTIRRALLVEKAGYQVLLGGFNIGEIACNMARDLRARAGDEYFDQYVGAI